MIAVPRAAVMAAGVAASLAHDDKPPRPCPFPVLPTPAVFSRVVIIHVLGTGHGLSIFCCCSRRLPRNGGLMPEGVLRPVLGMLGLTQIRHVAPVRRGQATGLVARVYRQVEADFGVLAPPIALHACAPQTLAAAWVLLRESLVVPGTVSRVDKEAVAAAVSRQNACPYCVTIHGSVMTRLGARGPVPPPAGGDPEVTA